VLGEELDDELVELLESSPLELDPELPEKSLDDSLDAEDRLALELEEMLDELLDDRLLDDRLPELSSARSATRDTRSDSGARGALQISGLAVNTNKAPSDI
jgi:hypothetical protein